MATDSLKNQLKLLVKLAASDHHITERETKFIHLIGKVNGFSENEINGLIEHPEGPPSEFGKALTSDERFENLLHLLQMMKVDGKVHKSEIDFCEHMAIALGYRKGVVAAMSPHFFGDAQVNTDHEKLVNLANKYLAVK